MVVISFKDQPQFYHSIWVPEFPLHPENYSTAWAIVGRYLVNSVFVTVTTIIGVLLVSSLSAFVFARYEFPGKRTLFLMIISLLMVPAVLTMVPAFVWVKNLGIAGQQVFAIFILRGYLASLPEELFEAARVDGASIFQCYWRVAMPLSRPILSVVVITTLLTTWNDFIWPFIIISDDKLRTIPIGMAFFQGQYQTSYGPQMAGFVISSIPMLIVFLFTSREFVQGLTAGAIKL
jgi:ABC-type glycerol-3-phosphate transport system permease component